MTDERTRLTAAFNRWLDAHQYYTGSNQAVVSQKEAAALQITLKAIELGLTVLTGRLMSGSDPYSPTLDVIKSLLGGPVADLPGAEDIRKAGEILQQRGTPFDFAGMKMHWGNAYVLLGLFADALGTETLLGFLPEFSRLAKMLGSFAPPSMPIYARVLLIYEEPALYWQHRDLFNELGFQVNQINGVALRAGFVDLASREITWANGRGLWAKLTSRAKDTIFTRGDWEEVLRYY